MIRILIIQVIACIARIAVLKDIMGGLWMGLVILIGAHGCYEGPMNITYISCWGALCVMNGFFDVLGMVIPGIFGILTFQLFETCIRVVVPLAYLLGASFAYHLYLDYAESHDPPIQTSWITKFMPDIFMRLKRRVDATKDRYGDRLPFASKQAGPPQTQPHAGGGWYGSGGNAL
jgi:hypothetical protein